MATVASRGATLEIEDNTSRPAGRRSTAGMAGARCPASVLNEPLGRLSWAPDGSIKSFLPDLLTAEMDHVAAVPRVQPPGRESRRARTA
jgi:hypothetical protein